MSLLRPPYTDEYETSLPYNTNNSRTRRHSSALSSSHISNTPGPSFPQPTISGRIISVPYGDINVASPSSYEFQGFPVPFHAVPRPPPRPVPGIPLRTAPPSGPPHPGPAANHMQHRRAAVSEIVDLPRSRGMVINLPDPESLERLKPEELIEDVALRKFHNNLLHDADRFWYAVVPEWAKERLSDKEQARQNAIFGIIASEQHYVSELELWLKFYRDPLRTQTVIMAPHVVEPFIRDVFFNVEQIKLRHEVLLQALFETQKKNYHQVYSIMDDLFDAVSSEEFQRLYVDYIANINKALARHHREVEENQLYAAFVSSEAATARHPRIRRLDFDSFARRAERRLGQLKLQVEEVQKKAEASHPDKEGITGIILEMLHRTVMLGQANGQAPAEETALRTFRECLENHPWDLADLGLAQAHRAVKYAGNVTQVYPPSSIPLHMVLLDNYLVFTQSISEDGKKKRMVHKPIPLEIIDAELDTSRLRTRTRMVSMLSRRESFEVVRFSLKHNGKEVLQVGARTKTMAEKWIQHIAEAASLRKQHVEENKLLDTSYLSLLSHSLKNRGDLVAACPFVYNRTVYVAGATITGIFVGAKTGGQAFHSVLPITGISQIICVPGMRDLVIVHKDVSNKVVLSKILMDSLMSSNRRTSWLAGTQVVAPLSDPNDGDIITACAGIVEDCILVAYISKNYVRRKLHILAYRVTSNALQRLGEPTTISDSAQDLQLSFVSGMIFISGSSCQVIMRPTHAPNVVSSWPVFDSSYSDNFNLKALCDSSTSQFVRAVETGPDKLLLVYNTHGCFVTGSGQPISSHRIHEWAIEPKAATYCDKYIVLFSDRKLEIRDGDNGQPLQITDMPGMKLLHSVVSYSSSEVKTTLFATTRPDSNYFNLLGELASTLNVASPH